MGFGKSKRQKEEEMRQQQTENLGKLDKNYVMVASIDFGTTFSGYAFSLKQSMMDIRMNRNWGSEIGCQSFKVCILLVSK